MSEYLYNDYIKTLSDRFELALSTIQTGHNFEFGVEFEIVLCEILMVFVEDILLIKMETTQVTIL